MAKETQRPTNSCANYPICKRPRSTKSSLATCTSALFCGICSSSPVCVHPGCPNHSVPAIRQGQKCWNFRDNCAEHVADPLYESVAEWSYCSNDSMHCHRLSLKNGGGLCYACKNSFLPCASAPQGCSNRVFHSCSSAGLAALCIECSQKQQGKEGNSEVSPSSVHICSTNGCSLVAVESGLCLKCETGFVICSTETCFARVSLVGVPFCDLCISKLNPPRRITKKQSTFPCCFQDRGCKNVLPRKTPNPFGKCIECLKSGPPCSSTRYGCTNRCVVSSTSQLCPVCLIKGPKCRGVGGHGCSQKLRAAPDNNGFCWHCRRKQCGSAGTCVSCRNHHLPSFSA